VVTDIDVDAHEALARDLRLIISDIRRLDVAFLHVDAEGQLHSAFKLRAMSRSPYARTVYLDKDTRVCASLTGAFDLLPRYDFVATQAAAAFYEGGPDPWTEDSGLYPVPPSFIQFCAAVIFYRRSARVSGMFRLAISEADRLHPAGFLDQAALRNALYHAPSVRTFALTPSWQCRGAHSCRTSFASPQVVTDRQISGKFLGQRCIVLHQHALQDADPRQPLTGSWATSPVVRARFAWDQGLYTNELLPRGIPSRHHYLRSQSSALYHDMLAFSDAWLPEARRSPAPEGPAAVLGVANADFARLWHRRWEYPFHMAALRYFRHHLVDRGGRKEGGGLRVLYTAVTGGSFFPSYLAVKLREAEMGGGVVLEVVDNSTVVEAYQAHEALGDGVGRAEIDAGVEVKHVALDSVPLTAASVDAILCVSALQDIENSFAALREFARVLRAGGILSVSLTLALCSSCTTDERHHSVGGARQLLKVVGSLGFDEIDAPFSVREDLGESAVLDDVILTSSWMAQEDPASMPWLSRRAEEHLTISCHVFRKR
jgi:SAM-dependent methyltransferase